MKSVPGTWEHGDPGAPVQTTIPLGLPISRFGPEHVRGLAVYRLGECSIIMARERAGLSGEWLWHLSLAHPERHPTWDEIKTARYRLLPGHLTFGMLLPPPEMYVNVPSQDHVFHLWEITDPREPWSAE